jgi:hypothetical protein
MSKSPETSRWNFIDGKNDLSFGEPETWYKGEHCNNYPNARPILESDILLGYIPKEKLIGPETKVLALGSCFAEHFSNLLAQDGYNNWNLPLDPHTFGGEAPILPFLATFENIFVVLQQLRWAFDDFTPKAPIWFQKDKKLFEATEDRRARVKFAFNNADIFVITLGLSEVWFDAVENEPMWRTIPKSAYEPGRHVNRRVTVAETVEAFHSFNRIADKHLPGKRFIFTLSPVPLAATFRNQSAISANLISKSILRVAIDDFINDEAIMQTSRYFYFPSYELIYGLFDKPLLPDNFHVRPDVIHSVLEIFKSLYTDLPAVNKPPPAKTYIEDLEEQVRTMNAELLAKELVIRELDTAARERLEILQRLSGNTGQP